MRAVHNKSTEFYLIVGACLQSLDDLYRQRLKLRLIFCEELDAGLLLPLEQSIHRLLIVLDLLLEGQGEEGGLKLRVDLDPAFGPA